MDQMAEEDSEKASTSNPVNKPKTAHDALVEACDYFMQQTEFICLNKDDAGNWKSSGVYSLVYFHKTCPFTFVQLTGVSLGPHLNIFGQIDKEKNQCVFELDTEIIKNLDYSDRSAVIEAIPDFQMNFKDQIALPLLASAQNISGVPRSFGLQTLPREIHLVIAKQLSVPDLLSLSRACLDLHEVSNEPQVWKNALFRDFPTVIVAQNSKQRDWKKLYIKNYLEKQQRNRDTLLFNRPLPPFFRGPLPHFLEWTDNSWDQDFDPFPSSPGIDFLNLVQPCHHQRAPHMIPPDICSHFIYPVAVSPFHHHHQPMSAVVLPGPMIDQMCRPFTCSYPMGFGYYR